MRNADYAPTDTHKLIRLIECLKSGRFYRSFGASHASNRSSASMLPISLAFVSRALFCAFVVLQLNPMRGIGGVFICSGAAWLHEVVDELGEPRPVDRSADTYAGFSELSGCGWRDVDDRSSASWET